MDVLTIIQIVAGSVCLAVGGIHFVAGRARSASRVHLWFALAATFAGGNAFFEAAMFAAGDIAAYNRWFKWAIVMQGSAWIALAWYIGEYAPGARRWLRWLITGGFGLALLVHILSPYGVLFSGLDDLMKHPLPWGGEFSYATGPANPWRVASDLAIVAFMVYAIDAIIGLIRRKERRRAWRLGLVTGVVATSLVLGSLIDLSVLVMPYPESVAFLIAVGIMGVDLADEAVRASGLSREVVAQESRWRTLLEQVRLLVVGVDRHGKIDYVNPHFCRVSGWSAPELIGRPYPELLPESLRGERQEQLDQVFNGEAQLEAATEGRILRVEGDERVVLWSNVLLRDRDEGVTGILGVGVDLTDRREAETARDAALRELEGLKSQLEEENLYLREEIRSNRDFGNIIGESDALSYVLHRVQQVAGTDTTVLIEGETGVGKELVARAIHDASPRAAKPFVRVNCAALPGSLIESELFGHEAGAFTGATRLRKGRFELADGGTMLLDEIGELAVEVQGKLLRVLQEGEFERVGSSETRRVDVRVVASTNRNLQDEFESGRFREDLFYRLHVYPITVPPLRDRSSDIPLLVNHLLSRICERTGRVIREVPGPVMHRLREYDWPGNVRELQNVLERAVIVSSGLALQLPEGLHDRSRRVSPTGSLGGAGILPRSMEEIERLHIQAILKLTDGRVAGARGAAEILRMNPNTLRSRMKKLGIGPRRDGNGPHPRSGMA